VVQPQILYEVIVMTKKQAKIMEKYVAELLGLKGCGDKEIAHGRADDLLLEVLTELGFGQVSDAWETVQSDLGGFWYA
jgi:hypothetical protein